MKNKLITFLIAMGIPVSTLSVQGPGCTGLCGNCSFNCTPGIFALLLLVGKYCWRRLKGRVLQHE
ncbi:MAG: hypothetical protein ACI3XC_05365 [Phascolarctobacterium sp.]